MTVIPPLGASSTLNTSPGHLEKTAAQHFAVLRIVGGQGVDPAQSRAVPVTEQFYTPGGGLASDERTLGLPLHVSDTDELRAQLAFLTHAYNIPVVSSAESLVARCRSYT